MHTVKRRGRGSRVKFLHFTSPSPRLPGLSSVTKASPCGHHVSLRRRRRSRVPESPQPPPPRLAQRVGRVVLPWPSPGGRGPRASCVAAQTRRLGAAHAAAGRGVRDTEWLPGGQRTSTPTHTHAHTPTAAQAAEVDAGLPPHPRSGRRLQSCKPARPAATACTQPGIAWPPRQGGLRLTACRPRQPTQQPHLPAVAEAPATAVPFPPRAAAFGCLPDSSRLHTLPDFKHKQAPPPPRGVRRASTSPRLPRLGSLLVGPGRDVRVVTPRSPRRSLSAPRAGGVRLAISLPPCVSPPVLRCSVRIALL